MFSWLHAYARGGAFVVALCRTRLATLALVGSPLPLLYNARMITDASMLTLDRGYACCVVVWRRAGRYITKHSRLAAEPCGKLADRFLI